MSILNEIDLLIENFMESSGVPGSIVFSAQTAQIIKDEIGETPKTLRGIPVIIDNHMRSGSIAIVPEYEEETGKTPCPVCNAMSYENGYCECGLYRGRYEMEEEEDLLDLMGNTDEALRYGFSIITDEE